MPTAGVVRALERGQRRETIAVCSGKPHGGPRGQVRGAEPRQCRGCLWGGARHHPQEPGLGGVRAHRNGAGLLPRPQGSWMGQQVSGSPAAVSPDADTKQGSVLGSHVFVCTESKTPGLLTSQEPAQDLPVPRCPVRRGLLLHTGRQGLECGCGQSGEQNTGVSHHGPAEQPPAHLQVRDWWVRAPHGQATDLSGHLNPQVTQVLQVYKCLSEDFKTNRNMQTIKRPR